MMAFAHEHRSYDFRLAKHWRAGVFDRLEITDGAISLPAGMAIDRDARTGAVDSTPALAVDPCGELWWVRDPSYLLMRRTADDLLAVGNLLAEGSDDDRSPQRLVRGLRHSWLLVKRDQQHAGAGIIRFDAACLHRQEALESDRGVLDVCSDRHDGIWALLGGDAEPAELIRLETPDRTCSRSLPMRLCDARMDGTCDGRTLVLLDRAPPVKGNAPASAWRLLIVSVCGAAEVREIAPPRVDTEPGEVAGAFSPNLLAVDDACRVHLVDGRTGEWWTLSIEGAIVSRRSGLFGARWLPLRAIAARSDLHVLGRRGLGRMTETAAADPAEPGAAPTYITPVLVSPEATPGGWMRADLDIDLAPGAAIEIDVATTRSRALVTAFEELLNNVGLSGGARLQAVDAHLPWVTGSNQVVRAEDLSVNGRFRLALHEIADPYLWVRIRIHAAPGLPAPRVRSLRVLYPNISYLRYLPAVFQADENATRLLRRLLVPIESVFGDFEVELAEMAGRIDPRTAPPEWYPFLLSWLGLPQSSELSSAGQRELLRAAPELLERRGTRAALEQLLQILLAGLALEPAGRHPAEGHEPPAHFEVRDSAEAPLPWTFPERAARHPGPRLGRDTLVYSARQPGFQLGRTACLGAQNLGYSRLDPTPLFERSGALVELRIAAPPAQREKIERLLARFLPYFIPAHCACRVRWTSPRRALSRMVLNTGVRIRDAHAPQLGDETRLGQSTLWWDRRRERRRRYLNGGLLLS